MSINETVKQPAARLPTKKLFRFIGGVLLVERHGVLDDALSLTAQLAPPPKSSGDVVLISPNHRHCRLLRTRSGRPRHRRTAGKRDEIVPSCLEHAALP